MLHIFKFDLRPNHHLRFILLVLLDPVYLYLFSFDSFGEGPFTDKPNIGVYTGLNIFRLDNEID